MKQEFAKSLYLYLQEKRHEDITGILAKLEESQWYSTERLLDEQWSRFLELLEYTYQYVPFYRKRFDSIGLQPGDIKTRDDLKKIPVLTKAEIRAGFDDFHISSDGLVEKTRTSGSTGEPLKVIRDRQSTGYHRANMFRLRRWFNSDIGSFEATFRIFNYPFMERQRTRIKDFLLNRVRINERDLSNSNLEGFYRTLLKARPETFYGFPSLMVRFANFLIREGVPKKPFPLKVIIATSEMLYPGQKTLLEDYFGAPVVNEYGCTEAGIIAIECPSGGWHIPVESCLVETIPADDLDLDPGIEKIVVTDLMNRAMPFIRYEVGDLGKLREGTCPCGRGLPMIEGVTGRIGHLIDLPDHRTIHSFIFFNIFRKAETVKEGSVREFQVRFHPPGRFELLIVKDNNFSDEVLDYIKWRIKDALGVGCQVEYHFVDEIILARNGKFEKFVVIKE